MTPKKPRGPTTEGAYALEQRRKLEERVRQLEAEVARERARAGSRAGKVPRSI